MYQILALALTLVVITAQSSGSPTGQAPGSKDVCTECGYPPTYSECCPTCPYNGQNVGCMPACGLPCNQDTDCGNDRYSICSACVFANEDDAENNIPGVCQSNADFGNCVQQNPWQPGQPQAPVLPSAWNSSIVVTDYITKETIKGFIWYDDRFGALRNDFFGKCPFVELAGNRSSDGDCTVLFYKGYNYYFYPDENICCGYKFPVWKPDNYR